MTLSGKRVLVTGSSGFIGGHLLPRLNQLGATVVPFDITDGRDITRWDDFDEIGDIDVAVHLAAVVFVPFSQRSPQITYQTNIVGTTNVLELCRRRGARMVFASSYIYGSPHYLPVDETHPVNPTNPYARSKVMGELLCEAYQEDYDVPCVVLRPFNIYGEGQNEHFLIPEIRSQLRSGDEITLKDLTPRRDFLYVSDAVEAYIKAAEFDHASYQIFNIGSGSSCSVLEIAEKMALLAGKKITIRSLEEERRGEISETVASIKKAEAVLSWRPQVQLEQGLKKVLDE